MAFIRGTDLWFVVLEGFFASYHTSRGQTFSQGGGKKEEKVWRLLQYFCVLWNVNQLETCDVGGVYQAIRISLALSKFHKRHLLTFHCVKNHMT